MNRPELVTYLVESRFSVKRGVKNPSRIKQLIREDLEGLSTEELQAEYDYATGAAKRPSGDGANYQATTLDHAISDALVILSRGFDPHTAEMLLLDDYDPAVAGRALVMAANGEYRLELGHVVHRAPDRAEWKPISLADYLATTSDPMPASLTGEAQLELDDEEAAW